MAEYRTLRMTFWNDPYVEELGPEGRLFYLYLITCPHTNNLGFLEVSRRRMAYETGLSEEVLLRLLSEAEAAGKIVADGACLWLVNFVKHQASTSPKLVQSLRALLGQISSLKIRAAVAAAYPAIFPPEPAEEVPMPGKRAPSAVEAGCAQPSPTVGEGTGNRKGEEEGEGKRKTLFRPPEVEEVRAYCEERGNGIEAGAFVDFYASKGWKVGTSPMKDWRAAVRTWEAKRRESGAVRRAPAREENNGEAVRRAVERMAGAAAMSGEDAW